MYIQVAIFSCNCPEHAALYVDVHDIECSRSVETMGLFLLPRDMRVGIVCLLLSAVKVDKDVGEVS